MRKMLMLVSFTLGTAEAAEKLVGPPLPGCYRLSDHYADSGRQVISAVSTCARVSSLVMVRSLTTGRTLWKQHVVGEPTLSPLGRGQGAVAFSNVFSGAVLHWESWLLRLNDGAVVRRGLFNVAGIQVGRALLVQVSDTPPLEDFIYDGSRLTGEVVSLASHQTLTRNFPVPARPGCGSPQVSRSRNDNGGSTGQDYAVQGNRLTVPRVDRCGQFDTTFQWAEMPLPTPTQTGF